MEWREAWHRQQASQLIRAMAVRAGGPGERLVILADIADAVLLPSGLPFLPSTTEDNCGDDIWPKPHSYIEGAPDRPGLVDAILSRTPLRRSRRALASRARHRRARDSASSKDAGTAVPIVLNTRLLLNPSYKPGSTRPGGRLTI